MGVWGDNRAERNFSCEHTFLDFRSGNFNEQTRGRIQEIFTGKKHNNI